MTLPRFHLSCFRTSLSWLGPSLSLFRKCLCPHVLGEQAILVVGIMVFGNHNDGWINIQIRFTLSSLALYVWHGVDGILSLCSTARR